MTATTPPAAVPSPAARKAPLRALWFQVHLWIGVALTVLFIPLGLTGAALVWPDLLSPQVKVGGAATLPASRYLEAGRAALGDKAAPAQLRFPEEAGRAVIVSGRPTPRDRGAEGARAQGGDHRDGDERGAGREHREDRPGGEPGAGREHRRHDAVAQTQPSAETGAAPPAREPATATTGPAATPRVGADARPRMIAVQLAPDDARVLSVGPQSRSPAWMWMHTFHERLFIEGWGRAFVGWLGVAMLISALTGLWLWWPRAGDFARAFGWRRSTSQLLNLHYTGGFWICVPLAILAFTGAMLGFPQTSRGIIGNFAPVTQQARPGQGGPGSGGGQRPLAETHLTIDQAIAAASPSAKPSVVTLPTRAQPAWKVEFAGAPAVTVDDATGAASPAPAQPGGDQAWRWVHRIHGGDDTPLIWKLILTLGGLAPTLLGVTGVIVWARKELRQRARARTAART